MLKTLVLTCLLTLSVNLYGQNKVVSQREVYDKIVKAGVAHPEIVLKQAIHESANFKSKGARNKNNILGLMKTVNRGTKKERVVLRTFDSIDSCINFYKRVIQGRYNGGDYYKFLRRIPYATDPKYKYKVHNTKLDFIIE